MRSRQPLPRQAGLSAPVVRPRFEDTIGQLVEEAQRERELLRIALGHSKAAADRSQVIWQEFRALLEEVKQGRRGRQQHGPGGSH
jgi:hypothetical protein